MDINEIILDLKPVKNILVIGAGIVDVIINIEKIPKSGGDIQGDYRGSIVGGCGFNVADVLHKFELPFDIFIPVGGGPYSNIVKEMMCKKGYPIYTEVKEEDNGWCMTLVETGGERTFITMPGIEIKMKKEWFDCFDMKKFDYLYIAGYELLGESAYELIEVLRKKRSDAVIIFDPGPRGGDIQKDVMNGLFALGALFTINDTEALKLTGEETLENAGKLLYGITKQPAVITLGAQGAMIVDENVTIIPGFEAVVVDTVGAGDAHTGGILAGLMCNLPIDKSVYLANKIASIVVSKVGPGTAPTLEEIMK